MGYIDHRRLIHSEAKKIGENHFALCSGHHCSSLHCPMPTSRAQSMRTLNLIAPRLRRLKCEVEAWTPP